jgi:signal transduction histidine kinase/small ligand-binding sensory domain FIST
MKTFNLVFSSIEELKTFLEKNIKNEKNVLLQIFSSYQEVFIIKEIIKTVKEYNKNVAIIGTTTDGEIFESSFFEYKIVLSFTIFEKTSLKISYVKINDNYKNIEKLDDISKENIDGSYKAGAELAKKAVGKDTKAVIIFADGLNTNLENFLQGFESINNSVMLAGGLSGDNAIFHETLQIVDDKIDSSLAVAVSLNSKELIVNNGYNFGWRGIGKDFTITKSYKNIVEEIDNKPVLEIYREYLGEKIVKALPKIGVEIPFVYKKENELIARAVVNKKENKLIFAGNLKTGTKVRFAMPSIEENEKDLKKNIQLLRQIPIESIFVYSCMARRRTEPKMINMELNNFSHFSNTSGFFTYGEIFSKKTENGYKYFAFNETTTFLILSEGGNYINKNLEIFIEEKDENCLAKEALINFINKTTDELYKINKELEKKVEVAVEENIRKNLLLQQQSKQAQMGEMVSMIAHQWRQPLNVISLFANNIELDIQMGEIDKNSILETVKNIKKQTQKMSEIINSFADFIKPDVKKVKFLLKDVLQKSMEIMYAQLKARGIDIHIEYSDETIEIEGYITLLEQVIINLVSNARDEFERTKQDKKIITINCKKENNFAIIEIEDNVEGGIPKKIQDKIFNPYFTTKGVKGTGLGLYMLSLIHISEPTRPY